MPSAKDSGISNALLAKIAENLEKNGSALKSTRAENMRTNVQLAQLSTNLETLTASVNMRLDRLEARIEGNGGPGLKTSVALLTQRLDDLEIDVNGIERSKKINAEKRIDTLEAQKREDKSFRWTIILAIAAVLISLSSTVGNCAPGLINAFSEPSIKPIPVPSPTSPTPSTGKKP